MRIPEKPIAAVEDTARAIAIVALAISFDDSVPLVSSFTIS